MDRTLPTTSSEEIQLYMRTYYSVLRSSGTIRIDTLVESHIAMHSSLHVGANEFEPDVSALLYSALRLSPCVRDTSIVLIGQTEQSFIDAGYTDIFYQFDNLKILRLQYLASSTLRLHY